MYIRFKSNLVRLAAAVVALGAMSAWGEALTLTLKSELTGSIDWTAQSSYESASRAPTAGDTVVIPANMTATLASTDTASWSLVSSLLCVRPSSGATFVVNVAGDTSTLACQVSCYYSGWSGQVTGTLQKTGDGTLSLNRTLSLSNSGYQDYRVNFDLLAGAVELPNDQTHGTSVRLGDLAIASGASFYPVNGKSGTKAQGGVTAIDRLTGSGAIVSTNAARQKMYVYGHSGETCTFDGTISGILWMNYSGSPVKLTASWPNFTGTAVRVENGAIVDFQDVSTFGSGDFGGKGTFRYSGSGTATFGRSQYATEVLTLDAGSEGAISWSGPLSAGLNDKLIPFILSGDSTARSTWSGVVNYGKTSGSVPHLVKRGSGTWRKSNDSDNLNGAIDVENGTLEFTSIKPRGTACSLGTSEKLYKAVFSNVSSSYAVPWAFLLGGSGTEGLLSYVGSTSATCTDRPFAVQSVGGVAANGTGRSSLSLAGFSAAGAGERTLLLDGANTEYNVAGEITDNTYSADGSGTLGIEKRGAGTWRLTGTQSFSGPVNVKEGTLIVNNNPANTPYRYFRFYLKENAFSACTNNTADGYYANILKDDNIRWQKTEPNYGTNEFRWVQLQRFHLYDQNGQDVVSDLTSRTIYDGKPYGPDASLREDAYSFANPNNPDTVNPNGNQSPSNLFITINTNDQRMAVRLSRELKLSDPTTWGCIELRVKDNAPEIFGYDVYTYRAGFTAQNKFTELAGRALVSWEVQGSTDGVTYEPLHSVTGFKMGGGTNGQTLQYWASDPTNMTELTASHANNKFFAFSRTRSSAAGDTPNPLANASVVSVAPGATLEVVGAPVEISKFQVAVGGAGTLRNVAFAETGTLYLTGMGALGSQTFPIDFSQTTGSENLEKWTVFINGKRRSTHVHVTADGITFTNQGLVIILR